MENQEKDYMEIDLAEVFYILKENLRNIFVVTICCVLIAAAYVFLQPKAAATYTSEALVRVRQMPNILQSKHVTESTSSGEMNMFSQSPYSGITKADTHYITNLGYGLNLNQRFLTYVELLKSSALLAPVNKAIETTGTVSATPVKDTEMMKISFMANDAEKAHKGNELLIKNFQEYVSQKEHSEVRYLVSEGSDANQNSKDPAIEVVVKENIAVEVIDPPTFPAASSASRNVTRTLAASILLGILLGSGYAVLHALMNRKITTRQDAEKYLGIPVLALVPEEKSLLRAIARRNDESVWQKIGGFLWKEQN